MAEPIEQRHPDLSDIAEGLVRLFGHQAFAWGVVCLVTMAIQLFGMALVGLYQLGVPARLLGCLCFALLMTSVRAYVASGEPESIGRIDPTTPPPISRFHSVPADAQRWNSRRQARHADDPTDRPSAAASAKSSGGLDVPRLLDTISLIPVGGLFVVLAPFALYFVRMVIQMYLYGFPFLIASVSIFAVFMFLIRRRAKRLDLIYVDAASVRTPSH